MSTQLAIINKPWLADLVIMHLPLHKTQLHDIFQYLAENSRQKEEKNPLLKISLFRFAATLSNIMYCLCSDPKRNN